MDCLVRFPPPYPYQSVSESLDHKHFKFSSLHVKVIYSTNQNVRYRAIGLFVAMFSIVVVLVVFLRHTCGIPCTLSQMIHLHVLDQSRPPWISWGFLKYKPLALWCATKGALVQLGFALVNRIFIDTPSFVMCMRLSLHPELTVYIL